MRKIVIEADGGARIPCDLLDDLAPHSSEFLWDLAGRDLSFPAIHAMWTGPELSCPLPESELPADLGSRTIPSENATSFPAEGDIVLACLAAGTAKGLPPGNFFDLGIFWAPGGRLLMPFGWITGNVAATVPPSDRPAMKAAIEDIRRHGACTLRIQRV